MHALSMDIGGTHSRLAVFDSDLQMKYKAVLPTAQIKSYPWFIRTYLPYQFKPQSICIGFAGPISGRKARLTNAKLGIDIGAIRRQFKFKKAYLLNDFYVAAAGVRFTKDFKQLRQGNSSSSIEVIVGPGTGLGESHMIKGKIYPAESGYTCVSVQDDEEYRLLKVLRRKYGTQIYYEDILSGRGLCDLYDFFRPHYKNNEVRLRIDSSERKGFLITENSGDALCIRTIQCFAKFYGRFVRDTALKLLPSKIYLAGGISPEIFPKAGKEFMDEYLRNRKYQSLLRKTAIILVLERDLGLLGAAAIALGKQEV